MANSPATRPHCSRSRLGPLGVGKGAEPSQLRPERERRVIYMALMLPPGADPLGGRAFVSIDGGELWWQVRRLPVNAEQADRLLESPQPPTANLLGIKEMAEAWGARVVFGTIKATY